MEKKIQEADNSGINLSTDALKQLLLTVLEEAKKPAPPTTAELAAIAQKNDERASNAAGAKVLLEQRKAEQQICSHTHPTGETHCTEVLDGTGNQLNNYIICQKCQVKIRPTLPANLRHDKNAIYDTAKYNLLAQQIRRTDM